MVKAIASEVCLNVSMLTLRIKHLNLSDIPTFTCTVKLIFKTHQQITLHTTANICENRR